MSITRKFLSEMENDVVIELNKESQETKEKLRVIYYTLFGSDLDTDDKGLVGRSNKIKVKVEKQEKYVLYVKGILVILVPIILYIVRNIISGLMK